MGEMSIGTLTASHVVIPTERLDFLCVATFVKPYTEHDIGNGPDEMVAESESLMTRRGSIAEETNVADPVARPCRWVHLTSSDAVKSTKKTPETDIVLIEPLEPLFGGGFGEMNDRVIATVVLPLTSEESDTDTEAASPANIAGNATRLTPSMIPFAAVYVEIVTLLVAAAAAAVFLSPANWQTT